ncbi:MAG: hypothetical protein JW751_18955 [Polyangiaceae bacterium]|nr:hypothetical protein [Polyangiaceae bacterium]
MARLVASVPPPGLHLLRCFGVLSSHSRNRREVVPKAPADPSRFRPPPATGDQLELPMGGEDDGNAKDRAPPRHRWAWLLRHVFSADSDTCPRCGGPMRWLEAGTTPEVVDRLLREHRLVARAPPPPGNHWHHWLPGQRHRGPPLAPLVARLAFRFSW